MAYLIWVVRILFFILLFGLAARNTEIVHVRGYLGYEWQAPLALVLLAATFVGVLLGVMGAVRTMLYLRNAVPDQQKPSQGVSVEDLKEADEALGLSTHKPPLSYRKAGESLAGDEGA
jgi:lipopolysaccharide assembly protein A